ncbi:universal stress protein [Actinomadura sp. WMMB 499]|uniref:universal stress protein n=1 Tax=Actinomadura sp. WMMB 499 TaxID=1219491 RepID=UPI001245B074|nr:universal stress protein [Actinomadura sp. WMMB 499]QFG21281.1 universal stress protein [Actinomadura sp. WMMB 499]
MNDASTSRRPNILLGYDGSEDNDAALRWAVDEAGLRGLDLVMCYGWYWPYPESHVDPQMEGTVRRVGENILDEGVRRARAVGADGPVRTCLVRGSAAAGLRRESELAELIVVGTHERRPLPVWSTALRLPAHTRRPVIVARRGRARPGRLAVGFDGSAGAASALGFAFAEAALRGWRLRVVHACWEPGAASEAELPLFGDVERLLGVRTDMVEGALAPWRSRHPDVEVEVLVLPDPPREALSSSAAEADLIVVGDRGRTSGLDPRVLGATSEAMINRAPCTVAVVPGRRSGTAADPTEGAEGAERQAPSAPLREVSAG